MRPSLLQGCGTCGPGGCTAQGSRSLVVSRGRAAVWWCWVTRGRQLSRSSRGQAVLAHSALGPRLHLLNNDDVFQVFSGADEKWHSSSLLPLTAGCWTGLRGRRAGVHFLLEHLPTWAPGGGLCPPSRAAWFLGSDSRLAGGLGTCHSPVTLLSLPSWLPFTHLGEPSPTPAATDHQAPQWRELG